MSPRTAVETRDQAFDLGTLIARTRRLVWASASRRLEAEGDSMMIWQLLNALRRQGPLTQCELAARTGQHAAGVSRLLDGLERDGDVVRTRDPHDRRKQVVELTQRARRRLEVTDRQVAAASEEVLAPLTPDERRQLKALLSKLVGA